VTLVPDAPKFTEALWGPVLKRYLKSIDRISNRKWLKILAGARIFVEPEPEPIEIASSDDSDEDERGNIAPSSP
jgi:hypothetical protein